MDCQICQEELLEQRQLSAEALAHLDSCAECQAFAATLALAVPPVPAPELESRVRAACHGTLAARRHLRWKNRARRLLAGVAAAVAVVLSVMLLNTPPAGKNSAATRPLATTGTGEYTEALSWDVGVSLSATELDQAEMDLELLFAGL